ncbi:MAG TPA: cyanophycinase [Ignavibacteriaceae bacterium]|nr:cyanophycinase [Ignavibacteriaceae bacterium]
MKKLLQLLLILSFAFIEQGCFAQSSKGHLVIIGGGDKTEYIMQKIVDLAGGPEAKIIIIPNASSEPEESAKYNVEEFKNLGCSNVAYIMFNRVDSDKDSLVDILSGASGIFFSGGDQSYLTRDMLGTKLLDKVYDIYNNGGVISGTSAGAAVMSKLMITGNELINKDSSDIFISIQKNNVEVKEGFGFIKSAFIDQHFIKRKRLNRSISVVLENPNLLGIGIDESTCIVVYPDEKFEVIGENQVMIFDATNCRDVKLDKNSNLGGENIIMHLLINGDRFDLKSKEVIE